MRIERRLCVRCTTRLLLVEKEDTGRSKVYIIVIVIIISTLVTTILRINVCSSSLEFRSMSMFCKLDLRQRNLTYDDTIISTAAGINRNRLKGDRYYFVYLSPVVYISSNRRVESDHDVLMQCVDLSRDSETV